MPFALPRSLPFDLPRLHASEKPCHFLERTLRRRQSDSLESPAEAGLRVVTGSGRVASGVGRTLPQHLETFKGYCQVRATLARNQRVDFVDDHRIDRLQPFAGIRGEEKEQ